MFDSAVDAFGLRVENAINEYDRDTNTYPNDINQVLSDNWRSAGNDSAVDKLAALTGGRLIVEEDGKLKGKL